MSLVDNIFCLIVDFITKDYTFLKNTIDECKKNYLLSKDLYILRNYKKNNITNNFRDLDIEFKLFDKNVSNAYILFAKLYRQLVEARSIYNKFYLNLSDSNQLDVSLKTLTKLFNKSNIKKNDILSNLNYIESKISFNLAAIKIED